MLNLRFQTDLLCSSKGDLTQGPSDERELCYCKQTQQEFDLCRTLLHPEVPFLWIYICR
jgi:hypothetical protein